MPCPICRTPFSEKDAAEAECYTRWFGVRVVVADSPDQAMEETAAPTDLIPLCCNHGDHCRSMKHSSNWIQTEQRWEDSWVCFGCSKDVERQSLYSMMPGLQETVHSNVCQEHGEKAVFVDTTVWPYQIVGINCAQSFGVYSHMLLCPRCDNILPLQMNDDDYIPPDQIPQHMDDADIQPGQSSQHMDDAHIQPGQISQHVDDADIPPGLISQHVDDADIPPGQISQHLDGANIPPGQISQHVDDSDILPGQSSQHVDDSDIQPGQSSGHGANIEAIPRFRRSNASAQLDESSNDDHDTPFFADAQQSHDEEMPLELAFANAEELQVFRDLFESWHS